MSASERELTHPSWHRQPEQRTSPRESLMSQMVRAQLIFDRRTPASGMPAWRDIEGESATRQVDARVGVGAGEFLLPEGAGQASVSVVQDDDAAAEEGSFAQELAARLQLARERVDSEQVHLAQVGTVATAYLGRPRLRLVK